MLGANQRHFFVEALRPPHDYELDEAIATTYSLDLTSLLTVPVYLAFAGLDPKKLGAESPIALLEALRRTAAKIDVYADAAHIALPSSEHLLYGMLERLVVPARSPNRGSLHAKLWVLRYRPTEDDGAPALLRVLVLSRNLTNDRSWDISLALEGPIGGRYVAAQRELGELVAALPAMAIRPSSTAARERAARLAEDVRRAQLEVPAPYESVRFHAIGLNGKPWIPEQSDRLLVVSPFVKDSALQRLAESTGEPAALLSREEELHELAASTISRFARTFILHEQAEAEEGEPTEQTNHLRGLHAKIFMAKRGWDTHLYVGSANATNSALLNGGSVEVMAELVGKTSKVKGIDAFLGEEGLGPVMVPYARPDTPVVVDAARKAAEEALDRARIALVEAKLRVRFEPLDDRVRAVLVADHPLVLEGIRFAKAWLVTLPDSSAVDILGLGPSTPAELATCAVASCTGLVAVELTTDAFTLTGGLVLNLPTEGLPARRDEHIVRLIIDNRDRFLAYLVALLSDLDDDAAVSALELDLGDADAARRREVIGPGLLERLIRAKARRPERLDAIRDTVDALMATEGGKQIVPEEFMAVWSVIGGAR